MRQAAYPFTSDTLGGRLDEIARGRWDRMRSGPSLYSQAHTAMMAVGGRETMPWAVSLRTLAKATAEWYRIGIAPATITKRLNCLSALGVAVMGIRPPQPHKLQWWLHPVKRDGLVMELSKSPRPEVQLLGEYIAWATETGLRVEETLGLRWDHVNFGDDERATLVTVPGLKTATAQATIPITPKADAVLRCLSSFGSDKVFGDRLTYIELWGLWRHYALPILGVEERHGATLKALRRTAARILHVDRGMPIDVLRHYLRHENLKTTQRYLALVGGYEAEEMERWTR